MKPLIVDQLLMVVVVGVLVVHVPVQIRAAAVLKVVAEQHALQPAVKHVGEHKLRAGDFPVRVFSFLPEFKPSWCAADIFSFYLRPAEENQQC